jgi:phosphatidylinositol alpha-1,6-mannosyltransferase
MDSTQHKTISRGKEPLKIIMLSVDFMPWTGGIAQLHHNIAVGFARNGYKLTAIAPRYPGLEHHDTHLPYQIMRIPYIRGFFEVMAFLALVWEWVKDRQLLLISGTWVAAGLPFMVLKFLTGTPYILVVHGMDLLHSPMISRIFTRRLREYYLKKSFEYAEQVWANSENTGKVVCAYSINPDKVRAFPLPLREDFERIAKGEKKIEAKPHPGRTILLTIGKLVPYKGQDKVIQVLPRLRDRFGDVEYHIVGEGLYEDHLRRLVKENGMEKHVNLYGSVPNDRLPELYALCDVFVMASREDMERGYLEGFGLVYLEANALGKPVVGGRSGGVPSAVEDGVSGLLCDPDDMDDIFDKLSILLKDPEYAERLGRQGRERVLNNFLVEHMMQTLEGFIKQAHLPQL